MTCRLLEWVIFHSPTWIIALHSIKWSGKEGGHVKHNFNKTEYSKITYSCQLLFYIKTLIPNDLGISFCVILLVSGCRTKQKMGKLTTNVPQLYVVWHDSNSSVHLGRHATCTAVPLNKPLGWPIEGQPRQKILTFSLTWGLLPNLVKKGVVQGTVIWSTRSHVLAGLRHNQLLELVLSFAGLTER